MEKRIRFILVFLCLSFFPANIVFGTIDTQLTLVSNTPNTPSLGVGTLVIDVEARSNDEISTEITGFQDAFQMGVILNAQNPTVSFSNQLFPLSFYNAIEDYRASDGRVRYAYTFNGGTLSVIDSSWMPVVRVSIEYTMTNATSSINWFNGLPTYLVTNGSNVDITGLEEAIPPSLADIPLIPLPLEARDGELEGIPKRFYLQQNYPNPFNPVTTLRFDIPLTGSGVVDARLVIYNSLGQVVKTLHQGKLNAGSYEVQWDGTTDFGHEAPSGIYFAVFKAGSFSQTRKLVLMK